MKWLVFCVLAVVLITVAVADGEIWEEDDHEVLIRSERGAKNREPCKYVKGSWSECDPKTNMRSRTLTLKKGDQAACEATKSIQKKCKKACRYEKGSWSECNAQSQMTRNDKLKQNSDPSCEQNRQITKKCKPKSAKPTKGKACRYKNGSWSECNAEGHMTRNDKLKKNSDPYCDPIRLIQKDCKPKSAKLTKACRYEIGSWSECNAEDHMTRNDKLKENSDPYCDPIRLIQKDCKPKSAKVITDGKACRYKNGSWSECNAEGYMTRNDKLKKNSDPYCDPIRLIQKDCKPKASH